MKKILLYFSVIALAVTSCRKDDSTTTTTVDLATQNTYDDQAIQKFLVDHYFDNKGNVIAYSDKTSTNPSLSTLNPVTLSSGVVYIVRQGAQPTNGSQIQADDALSLMHNTVSYVATKDSSSGEVSFTSGYTFNNTISGTGVPEENISKKGIKDGLKQIYTRTSVLNQYNSDNSTTYTKSYFQIEGLIEGLQKFQAFDMNDNEDYNLQGIILVPSRAAFARDACYWGTYTDRSFVCSFQAYKRVPRATAGD